MIAVLTVLTITVSLLYYGSNKYTIYNTNSIFTSYFFYNFITIIIITLQYSTKASPDQHLGLCGSVAVSSLNSTDLPGGSVPVQSFSPLVPVHLVSRPRCSYPSFRQSCVTIWIGQQQPMFLPVSGRASTLALRPHQLPCGQPLLTCYLPLSTHPS